MELLRSLSPDVVVLDIGMHLQLPIPPGITLHITE